MSDAVRCEVETQLPTEHGVFQLLCWMRAIRIKLKQIDIPLLLPPSKPLQVCAGQTQQVPVGVDQKQHIELTRTLAERFNSRFGATFTVPEGFIPKANAKVYDLQEPTVKMSKSASSEAGLLAILDDPKVTKKKIMRAVTDTDGEIRYDPEAKPGVSNLLTIFAVLSGRSVEDVANEYSGRGYGDLKKGLAEVVEGTFAPIRTRTAELLEDRAELMNILRDGAERARERAAATLDLVHERIGFPTRVSR